jgi:tartrate dehydrogenase/decarboxylase/D-malate dehydrogenase
MSKAFRIAAIAGDGIGKEVLPEGLRVLEQAAKKWELNLSIDVLDWAHCDYYR